MLWKEDRTESPGNRGMAMKRPEATENGRRSELAEAHRSTTQPCMEQRHIKKLAPAEASQPSRTRWSLPHHAMTKQNKARTSPAAAAAVTAESVDPDSTLESDHMLEPPPVTSRAELEVETGTWTGKESGTGPPRLVVTSSTPVDHGTPRTPSQKPIGGVAVLQQAEVATDRQRSTETPPGQPLPVGPAESDWGRPADSHTPHYTNAETARADGRARRPAQIGFNYEHGRGSVKRELARASASRSTRHAAAYDYAPGVSPDSPERAMTDETLVESAAGLERRQGALLASMSEGVPRSRRRPRAVRRRHRRRGRRS